MTTSTWIEWMTTLMGGVSRQTQAAAFPPDRFYCLLDELPLHLIPQQARRSPKADASQLFLNPGCVLCPAGEVPAAIADCEDILAGLAAQGTIAWIPDDVTGSWLPFWLGSEFETAVRSLSLDEPAGQVLLPEVCRVLAAAGILSSSSDRLRRIQQWDTRLEQCAVMFRERGFAPIAGLLHPFHVAALRRYYRCLIRTGALRLGDGQTPLRYVSYQEPAARFFHRQMAPLVSRVAGEPVKPSYVYLASYLTGAELKKHIDRDQCEFSITLCLDFSPEPAAETPWPIRLETGTGNVAVYQALGDGLAYRGTKSPHYRNVLGEGMTSTSIFFHYVANDFKGLLA